MLVAGLSLTSQPWLTLAMLQVKAKEIKEELAHLLRELDDQLGKRRQVIERGKVSGMTISGIFVLKWLSYLNRAVYRQQWMCEACH